MNEMKDIAKYTLEHYIKTGKCELNQGTYHGKLVLGDKSRILVTNKWGFRRKFDFNKIMDLITY